MMVVAEETINVTRYLATVNQGAVSYSKVREKYLELCSPAILNSRQITAIRDLTEEESTVFRVYAYIKDHPKVLYKVFTCNGEGFSLDDVRAYGGAGFLGGMITRIFGTTYPPEISGKWSPALGRFIHTLPPGTSLVFPSIETVLAGIGVSIAVVAAVNVSRNIYKISNSNAFNVWKQKRSKLMKNASVIRVLTEDNILKEFLCPITKDLPDCPVRAPSNFTYDRKAIEACLKNGLIPPKCNSLFDKKLLRFDFSHANTVIFRIEEIIQSIKRDPSFHEIGHLEELTDLLERRRGLMVQDRLNDKSVAVAIVQDHADRFSRIKDQSKVSEKEEEEKRKNTEAYYEDMARDFRVYRQKAKKVKVCTDWWDSTFFFKDLFSFLGFKRTFVEVDVMPDTFTNISTAANIRKGIIPPPKKEKKASEVL